MESCCTTPTTLDLPSNYPPIHHPPADRLSSYDVGRLRKILLLRGICVTVLDRMVEKATTGLHPVVVSIKDFTVRYVY